MFPLYTDQICFLIQFGEVQYKERRECRFLKGNAFSLMKIMRCLWINLVYGKQKEKVEKICVNYVCSEWRLIESTLELSFV